MSKLRKLAGLTETTPKGGEKKATKKAKKAVSARVLTSPPTAEEIQKLIVTESDTQVNLRAFRRWPGQEPLRQEYKVVDIDEDTLEELLEAYLPELPRRKEEQKANGDGEEYLQITWLNPDR